MADDSDNAPQREVRDSKQRLSLVLRIPAAAGDLSRVVQAQASVIDSDGAVRLAMLGKGLSRESLARLRGRGQYFYLVQRAAGGLRVYRRRVAGVCESLRASEHRLVPGYYGQRGMIESAKCRVRLSSLERARATQFERLDVVSTGKSMSNLLRGMAALAIVQEKRVSPSRRSEHRVPRAS